MSTETTGAGVSRPPVSTEPQAPQRGFRERAELASAQIPFKVKVAVVWILIFAVLGWLFALAKFDTGWMTDQFGFIVGGVFVTVFLSVAAILLATLLALFGALGRLSKNAIAYGASGFYTSFFRGTPLIVQMFLIYLALPQIGHGLNVSDSVQDILTMDAWQAGILALGLNYGAYMTEIFRAGIQSVSHGQGEAAEALGMSYGQRMRRVVLPQAIRVIIPPTGNEFIAMIKDTALVSLLGSSLAFMEVFRRASLTGKADFKNMEALLVAAGIYWVITIGMSFFQARIEGRMSRGYVRGSAAPTRLIHGSSAGGTGGGGMMVEVPAGEEGEERS